MDEAPEREWAEPRTSGRRRNDGWHVRLHESWYRDVWLLAITAITVLTLASARGLAGRVTRNQKANTAALCALRSDLQTRVGGGETFLASHPHGIPGISAAAIRSALSNERHGLLALRPVICPATQRKN